MAIGAVCWLLAGWERSADFELSLEGWGDLGLSRFSASRGLDILAGAGLVSAVRRPGRAPIVSILDPAGRLDPIRHRAGVGPKRGASESVG